MEVVLRNRNKNEINMRLNVKVKSETHNYEMFLSPYRNRFNVYNYISIDMIDSQPNDKLSKVAYLTLHAFRK